MFPLVLHKMKMFLPGILMSLVLFACAVNPPVQEMSNARQTIQSAYEVKAQRFAPVALKEAERLLQQATTALDAGDYTSAREYAISAQQQAIKARQQALANNKSE